MRGWPVGMSVEDCIKLIDTGRLSPLWLAPFLRQGLLDNTKVA